MEFTEAEVMEELRELGYDNVPPDKLTEFVTDLKQLMRNERSRADTEDLSFASSAADSSSDGLAQYPHHTDFHWGAKHRNVNVSSSSSDTPRSAFVKSKVPLDENSFFNESFQERRTGAPARGDADESTSPKRFVRSLPRPDDSNVSSASSNNSFVVKRKTIRRDAEGKPNISTEEVTFIGGDDDDVDDDSATLDGDENGAFEDLPLDFGTRDVTRRVATSRPRSAGSESSSSSQGAVLPSFIRPQPEVRRRRHDPVNRFHQYNMAWASQRAPGEKQHKDLRWAVREQMQRREEIVTPIQRYYVPNNFVPPTDKKRQNLRWEIRTKLAHKLNPSKTTPSAFNFWM